MSGADSGTTAESGAVKIEMQAVTWLEQQYHSDWNDEDQAALDIWLAQSLAHRIAYLRMEDAWRYADRLSALRTSPREEPRAVSRRVSALKGVAAAAAVAALLGVGAMTFLSAAREHTYATAVGGHQIVAFDDGSRIELNTDTTLRISSGKGQRIVTLDKGEAYFQVTHDAKRPFIVIADGRRLTDLGTKFLVRKDVHRLRVAVFDGRVQFDPADRSPHARTALLTPGDILLATQNSQSVLRKTTAALLKDLGWRQGVITLDNATLSEAAAEFNRYNNRKLIIADAQVAQRRIVGTFRADNLDAFTSVAQDIFGLRVEKHKTEIVVSR